MKLLEDQHTSLNRYLGHTIRNHRKRHHLTIAEVSKLAGISVGMLSKIENGHTSTSLETLEQLSKALGVTLSSLFFGYNKPTDSAQFVKSGQGLEVVRRGTKSGHTYHLLAYNQNQNVTLEPFLISIEEIEDFPFFSHAGREFIYMLEGEVSYQVGDEFFLLQAGDSLTFEGETPHRPDNINKTPIRFLSIISDNKELT